MGKLYGWTHWKCEGLVGCENQNQDWEFQVRDGMKNLPNE